MAVNFNDDTWKFVETKVSEMLNNAISVCTDGNKSYKEVLQAQAKIAAYKSILNLPRVNEAIAATRGRNVN